MSYSWTLVIPPAVVAPPVADVVFEGEAQLAQAEATDYGFDIRVFPSLDMTWTPRRDSVMLADAFARRLFTSRGTLWAHPGYGIDIRDFLNDSITQSKLNAMVAAIEAQGEQDERIQGVKCLAAFDTRTETLRLKITVVAASGPFSMVLRVTKLTADILLEA